ncbi:pyridoxamine 5'-phosphate oxidase family protein [Hoeflea sp.]|uniref:pyridoxamine 5'-phosphate oxidase family protein n=1 Tax=Hoeflea sp. TaxID=1940281 RepID=UPI003BAF5DAC
MTSAYARIAFTPAVRAEQAHHGSDRIYSRVLSGPEDEGSLLTAREASFLEARDSVFQATVSETGWPYVQFKGGRPGFIKVIDNRTIAYADYRGNRQYVSTGNLRHNDRVSILAIDFARRKRLKLLGRAEISEDPDVIAFLNGQGRPEAERAVIVQIEAFDWNCPQHIPIRLTDAERGSEIRHLKDRIAELEQKLFALA